MCPVLSNLSAFLCVFLWGIVPAGLHTITPSTSVRTHMRTPSRQLCGVCNFTSALYSRRRRHAFEINLCSTKLLNKFYLTAYVCDYGTDSLPSARRDSGINMPEPGILHTFIYILRAPRFCPYAILIYLDHTYASLLSLSLCSAHTFSHTFASRARAST